MKHALISGTAALGLTASVLTACSPAQVQPEPTPAVASVTLKHSLSDADFATTNARLRAAIESRGFTLFAVVDHAAGAAKVDLDLAPNTLYIFGNPKGGTPLMQANSDLGLELPLKALVREENGVVSITVSDIRAITSRAGVSEPAALINKIAGALDAIMREATQG